MKNNLLDDLSGLDALENDLDLPISIGEHFGL